MGPHPAIATVRLAVRQSLADHPRELPLLVACSGGADSVALAAATAFEAAQVGRPAGLATIDHGLRDGSDKQAAMVGALGYELGFDPVHVVRVEVGREGGPEAAARSARYEVLNRLGTDSLVMLGHTADDQAETVLLGLGRGSGPQSIAGMRMHSGRYVRPFLGMRARQTTAACEAFGLPIWQDPHNEDPRFTRVRLRHEVMPLLEDVLAGGVVEALARTASQLQEDQDALNLLADHALELARRPLGLDVASLAVAPPPVAARVLKRWAQDAGAAALTSVHVRELLRLIHAWHGQGAIDLPGGYSVARSSGTLMLIAAGQGGYATELPAGLSPLEVAVQPPVAVTEAPAVATQPSGVTVSVLDADIEATVISADAIQSKIAELTAEIDADYWDREPLLVGVLKGAVMFMSDLARSLSRPSEMEFMAVSSYGSSSTSSGVVRILKDLDRDISGRDVLIVEDIIDSGLTLSWLLKNLQARSPASVEVVTLLRKPDAIKVQVPVKYVGFDIPNEFVVGYGLDYAERYRDLPYIGRLRPSVYGG
jgi:hypoxanthine phosphoribosyltransferase